MGKSVGYTCDRAECGKFEARQHNTPPPGWIQLSVNIERPSAEDNNRMDLCSNYCLALIAAERAEEDGTPITKGRRVSTEKREYKSPESLENAKRNGRRTSHKLHHLQKGVVVPECEFCQEITATSADLVDA